MDALFAYSLVPVIAAGLLLAFTALLRGRNARGLAAFCLALAVWALDLFLLQIPATEHIAGRLAAIGAFNAAGFLHAAYDLTHQRRYGLVVFAYLSAVAMTLLGVVDPDLLYGPRAMSQGPLFWPAMGLAIVAMGIPLYTLVRSYRTATGEARTSMRQLFIAGVLVYAGGMGQALLLTWGLLLPLGLYGVLAGLMVLANVVRAHEPAPDRRLLERSLLYSALTALLSAGFLFGVMSLMTASSAPLLNGYRAGAFFLLVMAALAFEPVRQTAQGWLGRRFLPDKTDAATLARALGAQEARADQASRLAELGQFTSAVAHEVRNPLGVLAAHVRVLEKQGADGDTLASMREQIDRAARFLDELLRYGRPRPLELRWVDLGATLELAYSSAKQARGLAEPSLELSMPPGQAPLIEADQAQLTQCFIVLFDNALLALEGTGAARIRAAVEPVGSGEVRVVIEDSGPGLPEALLPRLFQPFVTGRKREGAAGGTGLGLAIARGIVERHGGTLRASRSEALGGARFELRVPRTQAVLAAAQAPKNEEAR
jgi:signal transduction histidine kinase